MFARAILLFLAASGMGGACWAKDIPHLTAEQWREDVDALVAGIEAKHRDPWNFVSRAKLEQLADEAKRADRVEDHAMVVALQRIAAAIGDGHSFVAVSDRYARYPFEVSWIEDGFYVVRAAPAHAAMLGDKLVAIDDVPIEKATEKLLDLVPRNENRWHERHVLAGVLTQAEPLNALGVSRSLRRAAFGFETADKRRYDRRFAAQAPADRPGYVTIGPGGRPAAYEAARGLRLRMLGDVAHLDFASYHALAADSPAIWAAIDTAKARALIVDFRKNGGGSLPAGRQYLVYPAWERSQLNREGCLFVLTGPATFSAAMTNVTDMRRETEAILIGLPTGANPNGYQENGWFSLPNSGLRVSVAQRQYRFDAPGTTAVMPDVPVEQGIADWRNGQDTVLNTALSRAQDCTRRSLAAE